MLFTAPLILFPALAFGARHSPLPLPKNRPPAGQGRGAPGKHGAAGGASRLAFSPRKLESPLLPDKQWDPAGCQKSGGFLRNMGRRRTRCFRHQNCDFRSCQMSSGGPWIPRNFMIPMGPHCLFGKSGNFNFLDENASCGVRRRPSEIHKFLGENWDPRCCNVSSGTHPDARGFVDFRGAPAGTATRVVVAKTTIPALAK